MENIKYKKVPQHIGIIPDGNRRWAESKNYEKHDGYVHGIEPGVNLVKMMIEIGIKEVTFYGFTKDNTKRPALQTEKYIEACINAVNKMTELDTIILVVGKSDSKVFPQELKKYVDNPTTFGKGTIKVNFLINYDWEWDLKGFNNRNDKLLNSIESNKISRIDMIIRWGGRPRLSGFLPAQSVYADFFVLDNYWPDFKKADFEKAMDYFQTCDQTLGG